MKSFFLIVLLLGGLRLTARAQQEADDKYVGIYSAIQQADTLARAGDPGEALAAFGDIQNQLQQFRKIFPDWNPNIIQFRLNEVADKIADLKSRRGVPASPPKTPSAGPGVPAGASPVAAEISAPDLDALRMQLQAVQQSNEILQAKLKEALALQPAAVDPRELERAQEKIRWLMKENDLLKAGVGAGVTPLAATVETRFVTNVVQVLVTNPPVVVTNFVEVFPKPGPPQIITNYVRVVVPDTNALEQARQQLAAAEKNSADEHARTEKLAAEISRLQESNGTSATDTAALLATLRAENDRLKNELAALRAAPAVSPADAEPGKQLRQSQALVASLQADAQVTALEKIALQNKIQQMMAATNAGVSVAEYEARIRTLTRERDDLIEKLDQAGKSKSTGKSQTAAQLSALNDEVEMLRSRLAVAEAPPVPYTPEELALFKVAVVPPANPDAGKKSIHDLPAGTAELVASAQQHFVHQEFDAAEQDYLKILDRDQNNGIALANLATIELQEGKLDAAEKHIRAALAQSPSDAFNLSTLGYLKFRQEKYDEALNTLSRAAQLDPNNPEIQNYLGVILSHQGQRKAAETALRRAIQLNPNYAPAHNNLAVIYLNQTPPLPDLARWHYQKALEAGQPRNPELEKMLADKGAPVQ